MLGTPRLPARDPLSRDLRDAGRGDARIAAMDEATPEIMIPLIDYEHELEILRELVVGSATRPARARDYTVGTMIELPRACFVANRIAKHADFLFRHERPHADRARASATTSSRSSCPPTWSARSSTARRSRRSTSPASAGSCGSPPGSGREAHRPQARHLRRARRRPRVDRLLPHGRARLRVLLAVPRADRARGRRAGANCILRR